MPKILWEAFMESTTMNAAIKPSYLEDCMFDQLLSIETEQFNSTVDTELFVSSKLKEWMEFDNNVVFDTLKHRLTVKVSMYKHSKEVPNETKLGKLVHTLKRSNIEDTLLVIYSKQENVGRLAIRVPNIDQEDENSLRILSSILELACLLHGVSSNNLTLYLDEKLDKSPLTITGSLEKLVEKLKSTAKNPYGHWDGPDVTFGKESDFKCTPPGLLAAMRLLATKDFLLRKITYKDSLKKPLTGFKLQETFNTIFGLKNEKSNSFVIRLIKALLASTVKPYNKGFPGGFIHSNRARNGVKSDMAVLTLLGWVPKVPSQNRLEDVLFNTVDSDLNENGSVKKRELVNLSKKNRNMSFQEFRTAVALSLRKINVRSFTEKDLAKDPLDVVPPMVVENFQENKVITSVNLMQQSYALKVSISNPKSKTSLVHYENSRNHFIASTKHLKLIDARQTEFSKFSELPENVQSFFRKRFRYPVKRQEPDVEMEEPQDINVTPTTRAVLEGTTNAVNKKRKITKGQATNLRKEARRPVTRSQDT
jgi:hypothetical protein